MFLSLVYLHSVEKGNDFILSETFIKNFASDICTVFMNFVSKQFLATALRRLKD